MIVKNASNQDLQEALDKTNVQYKDNLTWFDPVRYHGKNRLWFRLKTISLDGPGSHWVPMGVWTGQYNNGRRMRFACWHAHGDFFDNLFEINPEATVYSSGIPITIDGGNWRDSPRGHRMAFSQSCLCSLRKEMESVMKIPLDDLPLYLHDRLRFDQSKKLVADRMKGKA